MWPPTWTMQTISSVFERKSIPTLEALPQPLFCLSNSKLLLNWVQILPRNLQKSFSSLPNPQNGEGALGFFFSFNTGKVGLTLINGENIKNEHHMVCNISKLLGDDLTEPRSTTPQALGIKTMVWIPADGKEHGSKT